MRQQYDSYKPTGIHWIPIIPSHWQISSVGKHYQVILGKMLCPKPIDASYTLEEYYCAGDVHFDGVNNLNLKQMWFSPEEKDKYLVKDNDLLIVEGGAGAGGCALARVSDDAERYIQNSILIARHPKNSTALLKYIIENFVRAGYIDGVCNEATFAHFTKEKVSHVPYPLMPYAEQEAIAAWLDKKCYDIDAAIAKVDREIELIDELKQSEISRVVTCGLNPDAPLRPSGIDWINEIPFNWSSMKLKHTVKNIETDFMDGDWIESNDIATEGIRYLTSGNIGAGFYKEQGDGFITEETFAKLDCIEVFPGDLLISRLNEPIARTCFIPALGCRIVTCVDNVIYRPKSGKFDKRYMMYQLNSKPFWFNASQLSSGATMQRISRSKLGAIKVIVPPLPEQQAIADYLDKKCAEIDGLKAKLTKKRETLAELRQSIISEVVTGKRKVI